jgi:hypothetical protein
MTFETCSFFFLSLFTFSWLNHKRTNHSGRTARRTCPLISRQQYAKLSQNPSGPQGALFICGTLGKFEILTAVNMKVSGMGRRVVW